MDAHERNAGGLGRIQEGGAFANIGAGQRQR
jgi:hypothetical protein